MHRGFGAVESQGDSESNQNFELRSNNSNASFFRKRSFRETETFQAQSKPKFIKDKYVLTMFSNGGEKGIYTEKEHILRQ